MGQIAASYFWRSRGEAPLANFWLRLVIAKIDEKFQTCDSWKDQPDLVLGGLDNKNCYLEAS